MAQAQLERPAEIAAPAPARRGAARAVQAWPAVPAILLSWVLASTIFAPQELGADGALSVGMALRPPIDALNFLRHDVHPPLFYLALRGWLDLAGHHFLDARWLSLACGALSVALLYAIGRRLLEPWSAAVATWLFAVAPAFVSSSATVRDFAPGLMLSLLSLLLGMRAIERPSGGRRAAAFFANALALVTWYFHPVFILATLAYAVLRRPAQLPRLIGSCLGMLLLISPWLAFSLPSLAAKLTSGQTFSGGERTAPRLADLLAGFGNEALGHLPAFGDAGPAVGVLWLASIALGVLVLISARRGAPAVVIAVGGAAGLALFWYSRFAWVATNNPGRYFLVAIPFAALALGAIASGHRALRAVIVLAGLTLGANEYWRVHTLPPIPYEQDPLLNQLQAVTLPGDAAFFSDLDEFGRYELRDGPKIPAYLVHMAGPPHVGDDIQPMIAKTIPKLSKALRIWFVSARPDAPRYNALADGALEDAYYYVGQTAFPNNFLLREYANGPPVPMAGHKEHLGPVALESAGITYNVKPGGVLSVRLEWQTAAKLDQNYSGFLHLVADNGAVVAQQDGWPRGGLAPTSTWPPGETIDDRRALIVPSQAAPGVYRLVTGLYGPDGQPLGQNIDLGGVTVSR